MEEFIKGMDISFIPQLLDEGKQLYDLDGTPIEPLALAKKYGVNSIRLRIWNNPENVPAAKGYCSFGHTLALAKQIKDHGLGFMLDFHYSDHWADPGQQRKPEAWSNLCFKDLVNAVYQYTKETLSAFKEERCLPEIVQIGNEIRSGLLFPDGELPNYDGMVKLVNAGIRGAREVAGPDEMRIMIHLDQGGRYIYLKEWFDRAFHHGLDDFDIIGLSYYAFWHGTFMDLKNSMEKLVQDYGKPIIVAETAHAWRISQKGFIDKEQERIAGIPATPEGQKRMLDLVMNITAAIPNKMGIGVYYWEPLCVPREGDDGWSENMGILDETGKAHESIKSFLFTRQMQRFEEAVKIYEPRQMVLLKGTKPLLPEQLNVLYYDGSIRKHNVEWTECIKEENAASRFTLGEHAWEDIPGGYLITGLIQEISMETSVHIKVMEQVEGSVNLIRDGNWEEGFTQWTIEKSDDRVSVLLCPEQMDPFPAPPTNYIQVESPMNFHFLLWQEVMIQNEGKYKLQLEYRGTDTTNVDVRMFITSQKALTKITARTNARDVANYKEKVIHPTDDEWVLHEIEGFECKQGKVKVGIQITAPPILGKIRMFRLYPV